MYIPKVNRIEDPEVILEIMRDNPFATLVSSGPEGPLATHLPILIEPGDPLQLFGHLARANSHWNVLEGPQPSLLIFAGPHGYVSPRWYESSPNVPTWNYVSVHAYGRIEIIENEDYALAHLGTMVNTFDPTLGSVQPEDMDPEFHRRLVKGIVVFRMIVDRVDAKAKLNQNKSEEDRLAVLDQYLASPLVDERRMAEMMKKPVS